MRWFTTLLELAGLGLIVAGVALVSTAAAFVAAGLALCVIGARVGNGP